MIAKYLGETIRGRPGMLGLRRGQEYDVAEILECPTYLMARDESGGPWPVPGSARFQLDYSDFELSCRVPAQSCGYWSSESLNGKFGVVFTEEQELVQLEKAKRLLDADPPETNEPFDKWRKRSGFSGSNELAVFDYGLSSLDSGHPEVVVHRDVVYPTEYCGGVGVVGFWAENIVLWNMSVDMAFRILKWFLSAAGLPQREPVLLRETLWLRAVEVRFFNE